MDAMPGYDLAAFPFSLSRRSGRYRRILPAVDNRLVRRQEAERRIELNAIVAVDLFMKDCRYAIHLQV